MRSKQDILEYHKANAEKNGYYLTPDTELLDDLIGGLAANEERYGYGSCPCRISSGIKDYDSDMICPCEYRDADVNEFGMCYCCLYVSKDVKEDPSKMGPVEERRPVEIQDAAMKAKDRLDAGEEVIGLKQDDASLSGQGQGATLEQLIPVWRCVVCGYLAARERAPPICPICKAKIERFERFSLG
jgi:ferredoxin-thioredoxin reductase catalytic subunit